MSDSEEDLRFPEEIQPVRRRRGLRWLAILGGFLLFLVFCLTLLLTYWFPSELVRPELEARLSELLEGVVRVRSLSFNGLGADRCRVHQAARTFGEVGRAHPGLQSLGVAPAAAQGQGSSDRGRDRILELAWNPSRAGTTPGFLCSGRYLYRKVLSSLMTGLVS